MSLEPARGGSPTVILRADAGPEIGLGHVVRSLTLGDALVARGLRVRMVAAGVPPAMVADADRRGIPVTAPPGAVGGVDDATAVADRAELDAGARARALVVVDGYGFGREFFETLGARHVTVVVIDDGGRTAATSPALLLDQNPSAAPETYARFGDRTRLLLGLDHALVRRALVELADRPGRDAADRERQGVLVTMGGSDPLALTVPIARALAAADRAVVVAVGPGVVDRAGTLLALEHLASTRVAQPSTFEAELARAQVVVTAAGTTMWEAALLGTPMVAVVVADNQADPAAAAERQGFVDGVDARAAADPDRLAHLVADRVGSLLTDDTRRARLARAGRAAVDGRGSARVADALDQLAKTTSA